VEGRGAKEDEGKGSLEETIGKGLRNGRDGGGEGKGKEPPPPFQNVCVGLRACQGGSDGGISVFIPPKSAQVNFLWG